MKVLFVASDSVPHTGGKSTHILDLMDGMRASGADVELISFASLSDFWQRTLKLRFAHLKLMHPKLFAEKVSLAWGKRLNHLVNNELQQEAYDVVSFQDAVAASSASEAISTSGVRAVLTMHTYFGLENSLDGGAEVGDIQYQRRLERELHALDVVDGVVAVDERIRNHVCEAWRGRPKSGNFSSVRSIGNFADTSVYAPPTFIERETYRAAFKLRDDQFMISCVRRLVEKNGVVNAIAAIGLISDPNVVLMIAGEGPRKAELEDMVASHALEDRVKFLGSLDRGTVLELLKASDASVVPSITVGGLQEATSIAAIEAMACGVPTVASRIGGLTELIDGINTGLLVEEADPEDLRRSLTRIRHEPGLKEQLAQGGRSFIQQNHSHLEAARKYLAIFKQLSSKGAAGS